MQRIVERVRGEKKKASYRAIEEWLGEPTIDPRDAELVLAYLATRRPINEALLIGYTVFTGITVSFIVLQLGVLLDLKDDTEPVAVAMSALAVFGIGAFAAGLLLTLSTASDIMRTSWLGLAVREALIYAEHQAAGARVPSLWSRLKSRVSESVDSRSVSN